MVRGLGSLVGRIIREDCDRNLIEGLRTYEEQTQIAEAAFAAFLAELRAARALDGAATTVDGLRALEAHRAVERHRRLDGWRVPA